MFRLTRRPYKIGIALSGGGARGFAHAGALLALEEAGLKPDIIAGVSAGSVAAVLYAGGFRPHRIVEIFADKRFGDLCEMAMPRDGFFTMNGFARLIADNLDYDCLEELPIKTVVCATDMDNAQPVAFETGSITDCVVASCSIPIVFKPKKIDGVRYIDGGVLHNLPAWPLRDRCRTLIGLNCSTVPPRKYKDSLLDIAHASYNLAVKTNTRTDIALCDIAIEMDDIADYNVFNLKEIEKVFTRGYELTRAKLQEHKK